MLWWHSAFLRHIFIFLFFLSLFIYFEREKELKWDKGREREGESQADPSSPPIIAELRVGLDPKNREIMSWAEIKSQALNQLSHPGPPRHIFKNYHLDDWKSYFQNMIIIGTTKIQRTLRQLTKDLCKLTVFNHNYR